LVLLAQQSVLFFGDLQADSKLGVLIRECGGILFGASTIKVYRAEQITQSKQLKSREKI
jgi:hypothetical protein